MGFRKSYILDYRVVVKPDKRLGNNRLCFVAYCPTLGVADDGDSVQEALANIRKTITFHMECLQKEGREIPIDKPEEELVTNTRFQFSFGPTIRFAT